MMILIYAIIILANILWVFRRKPNYVILGISVLFIVLSVAGSVDNPDYANYFDYYSGKWVPPTVEKGYLLLSKSFAKVGFSYWMFLAITELAILVVYMLMVKITSKEYHLFIVIYMGYQLFLDYVQRRHAIATAIFVLGIYYLAKKSRIKYLIGVALTTVIHKSFLVYAFFAFWNPRRKKLYGTIVVFAVAFVLTICIVTVINGNAVPFLSELSRISFLEGKFDRYFTSTTRLGFVLPWACHFINVFVAYYSIRIILSDKTVSESTRNMMITMYNVILYSSFALVLTMINEEFIRYFRCCNILVALLACQASRTIKMKNESSFTRSDNFEINRAIFYGSVACNILAWVVIYAPNHVIPAFFSNNMWM
jgi:hypothetical protein